MIPVTRQAVLCRDWVRLPPGLFSMLTLVNQK
jgi:hypothetical protein